MFFMGLFTGEADKEAFELRPIMGRICNKTARGPGERTMPGKPASFLSVARQIPSGPTRTLNNACFFISKVH